MPDREDKGDLYQSTELTEGCRADHRDTGDDQDQLIELVDRCRAGDGDAWEKLFEVCLTDIKRTIIYIFRRYSRLDLLSEDTISDNILSTFEQAHKGIGSLKDPACIKSWLRRIAANCTISFLNTLNTRDNDYKLHLDRLTRSLSEPISKQESHTLEGIIPAPEPDDMPEKAISEILRDISVLSERDQWVLRLMMIFYNPFGKVEIQKLSEFLKEPLAKVAHQIDAMMNDLTVIAAQRESYLSDADRLNYEMDKLQYGLNKLRSEAGADDELRILEEKIVSKAQLICKKERSGRKMVTPNNGQVAAILGLTSKDNVSVIIHRARKRLRCSRNYETGPQNKN